MTKKIFKIGLILLALVGLLARFYKFGQVPLSLYWDEVAIGLDARSLLETGKDLNGNSWLQSLFISYGDYKAPVYIWLVTALGRFFSINQFTIRLPSLLAFLATVWVFYKLVKLTSTKNSLLPILATSSLAIMPWSIHFSRIGMESHLSLFFLTLSIYLLVASAKLKKPFLLILSALVAVTGIYTYISLRIIAPILFVLSFIIYHRPFSKKNILNLSSGLILITLGIFILTRSPFYSLSQAYRLSNDNLVTSTTYIDKSVKVQGDSSTIFSRLAHHRYLYKTQEYLQNYFTHFSPKFLSLTGDPNLRHHSGFGGELLVTQTIFMIIGLYSLFKLKDKRITFLVLFWILLSPIISSLVNEVPHASRAIYLIVPLAWLIGLGLNRLSFKRPLVVSLVFIALGLNLFFYLHDYFSHYPNRSAVSWLNPYKQTALVLQDKPKDKTVYITNQFYKPELYLSFYQNKPFKAESFPDYHFYLPGTCPQDSWCVAPPGWQQYNTTIIKHFSDTNELVIKQAL